MNYLDTILEGDCRETLKTLPDASVNCCVTSPPYWGLRDYGVTEQLGLEDTPEEYVSNMVKVFHEVKRVLKDDGTFWLNIGDTYFGGGRNRGSLFENMSDNQKSNRGTAIEDAAMSFQWKDHDVIKPKDLCGIPWRVAFALQQDGWYLRQDIIWHKPNPMPESVEDRCTKAHEYIFLLSKSPRYYYNGEAIKEKAIYGLNGEDNRPAGIVRNRKYDYDSKMNNNPDAFRMADKRAGKGRIAYGGKRNGDDGTGQDSFVSIPEMRNKRSVWTVTTKPCSLAHFATFPEDLILPCILAGCPQGGVVLDPFMGAGTTGLVAKKNGCHYIGCELNPKYIEICRKRLAQDYLFCEATSGQHFLTKGKE